ncbi:MAG TPA: leucyl/phenylalanyl-tRNA--protein transferase [Steroidobacteraceae bacterium]|nr:leucyl/phenylalanyl-tRNA--protein transferase [Steroidobacteraceae bacterium]
MDPDWFPPVDQALRDPPGLLAAGGDLNPTRLLAAYERGVFPWYSAQQPILWWSPDPRMVLFPGNFNVSRSLRKTLRNGPYTTRVDHAFGATIRECAAPRRSGPDTWLNTDMIDAYEQLFALGFGHSIETYLGDQLVGGLYGIRLGSVFFGESMFSREKDASKVAMARLVEECRSRDIQLIDCQVASSHLASLGAREVSRNEFVGLLRRYARRVPSDRWVETVHEAPSATRG